MAWKAVTVMLFSELYSAYYNAVAAIIKEAGKHSLSTSDIRRIAGKYAFGESTLTIPSALKEERWKLTGWLHLWKI